MLIDRFAIEFCLWSWTVCVSLVVTLASVAVHHPHCDDHHPPVRQHFVFEMAGIASFVGFCLVEGVVV
jgi:hypothetical protein